MKKEKMDITIMKIREDLKDHQTDDTTKFREMTTMIENRFGNVDTNLTTLIDQSTKHNTRLTKQERWQSYIMGGLTILAMIILPILFMVLQANY